MKLQIRVDEENGKIVDASFKTFGCGSAIASSSVGAFFELKRRTFHTRDITTEWVKGKQMEEVLSIKHSEIAKHISLPPVKLHCSMLSEEATKATVKDYGAKRTKSNESQAADS